MISLIESISSELNDFSTICVNPHPASFLDLSLFPQLLGELKEQPLDTLLPEIDGDRFCEYSSNLGLLQKYH